MKLTLEDRLNLIELAARYGNVMDDRDWDRLPSLFTEDATFEVLGLPDRYINVEGRPSIRDMLAASPGHPVAHHITNVEIRDDLDPWILTFKVIAPEPAGTVHSTDYRDRVERTPEGWRIREHVATRRAVK